MPPPPPPPRRPQRATMPALIWRVDASKRLVESIKESGPRYRPDGLGVDVLIKDFHDKHNQVKKDARANEKAIRDERRRETELRRKHEQQRREEAKQAKLQAAAAAAAASAAAAAAAEPAASASLAASPSAAQPPTNQAATVPSPSQSPKAATGATVAAAVQPASADLSADGSAGQPPVPPQQRANSGHEVKREPTQRRTKEAWQRDLLSAGASARGAM
eukprot:COSAG02_NODE_6409_length_3592_cov_2.471514_4_plen_219_part_00